MCFLTSQILFKKLTLIEGLRSEKFHNAFDAAPLLCLLTIASNIFTLKKDTVKTHCNNAGFNVLDNAPLVVYKVALVEHSLIMGFKSSPVDVRLSKMEVAIENIVFFTVTSNLVVN